MNEKETVIIDNTDKTAEPRRSSSAGLIILAVLALLALFFMFGGSSLFSGPSAGPSTSTPAPSAPTGTGQ